MTVNAEGRTLGRVRFVGGPLDGAVQAADTNHLLSALVHLHLRSDERGGPSYYGLRRSDADGWSYEWVP